MKPAEIYALRTRYRSVSNGETTTFSNAALAELLRRVRMTKEEAEAEDEAYFAWVREQTAREQAARDGAN